MSAQKGAFQFSLTAADAAAGVAAVANPENAPIIVTRLVLDIRTQSSAACTLDAGIAADASTLDDDLIDGVSVAAAGAKDNITDGGTNGKARQPWSASQYLTVSVASGASAGLVGEGYVEYIRREV